MEDNTINRRISFYRLLLKKRDTDLDPTKVFSYIDSLPFDETGRYLPIDNGNMRLLHVFNSNIPLKIIIGNTRRNDLPLLEKEGISSPLEISDNEGLYEPTHAMIFPNNVIGVEYNYYGPKAMSLTGYIKEKASSIVDEVELIPLMRSDFLEYVSRIGEVKVLELKVHRNMTKTFEEMDKSVYHALNALKDTSTAQVIGITLNSPSQKEVKFGWKKQLFNIFNNNEVRDSTYKAFIRAKDNLTNNLNDFNLLEPYLISNKRVIKSDSIHRSIDTNSMFNAIKESYYEQRHEINGVVTIPKKPQKKLDEFTNTK